MTFNQERKKELLTFLVGNNDKQPELFRKIIYKDLDKFKKFMDDASKSDMFEYTKYLNEEIYNSKMKEIKIHTAALKEQLIAEAEARKKGKKYESLIDSLDRKLYIIELQIDVGIYNLYHNKNVKFYFDV